ncbi:hypothetical protein BKA66DRAFT_406350 [Pyrenochaeta sp. MPI-SDFR-AT-0127]|nr:hypothetical protein BKA66DRAFT_406350 [Pyrenochaeta sp. MPI-SDFR-AT-0127]
MHSINSLYALTLALVVSSIHASPLTKPLDEFAELDRRATVDCGGGYRFLTAAQNKGYDDAIAHLDAGTTVTGNNQNPEYYGDQPAVVGIPASCKGPAVNDLRIYPVYVQETTTFTAGSAPGQDRVVIARHADGTRERCGLITHRGAAAGQFKWCGI